MTKAVNFTKSFIENLPPPSTKKRIYVKDSQVKGLSLAVQASGAKSFYVIKKITGRSEKIFLGKYPDLSIENARKQASVTLGQIALGINPQNEKRVVRAEMTFGELFEQYMIRYSKPHKKTWKADQRDIDRFLGHWFSRKLSDIKRSEVQRMIETIHIENGLYQANKMLQRIRAIFNKGIEWGWQGRNPATGIKKQREKSRDRFVQPHEMPYFLQALHEEPDQKFKDFFMILLTTGVRKTNALTMRWEDINWALQEWRIPETKNGDPVTIPLLLETRQILERRKQTTTSQWVFPRKLDDGKPLANPRDAWTRLLQKASLYIWLADAGTSALLKASEINSSAHLNVEEMYSRVQSHAWQRNIKLPAGLMNVRLHDLRRTFGSYQALTGASLQIIGKSLGHRSTQATHIYARLNADPVRQAMEKAIGAMFIKN